MLLQRFFILIVSGALLLSGCASSKFKARQEQRDKLAASSGMYCEFISGDLFPDLDVELSMQMARRCDANKNFSITNYKNSSNHSGVVYCCSTAGRAEKKMSATPAPRKPTPLNTNSDNDSDVIAE